MAAFRKDNGRHECCSKKTPRNPNVLFDNPCKAGCFFWPAAAGPFRRRIHITEFAGFKVGDRTKAGGFENDRLPAEAGGHQAHLDAAAAGPVEFAEKNPLPGAQRELAPLDRHQLRGAHQCGLDVGRGGPLPVTGRHRLVIG